MATVHRPIAPGSAKKASVGSVDNKRAADASFDGPIPMKRFRGRLKIDSEFCPTDVEDPFDTVTWEIRTSQIKGENGEVLFEQTNCEVPSFWTQLATNVICSKYFYGEVGTPEREYSVRQLVHRVSRTITDWGLADGYFATPADGERFYRDLTWLCLHQHGAFNSPVWFNVGLYHEYGVQGAKCNWHWDAVAQKVAQPENPYEFPQGSACFIQRVEDNMEDIMRLATSEAMLFKFGSGTGTDLSTLRSHREKLAGGGKPSGPLSFMRVYDQVAAVVKSGGKTRRAAKMQSIKVWHPDVMEFIECKWKEERKAQTLIASGKYEANFNGEAYSSIMFQNANLSVRVTDDFMTAIEKSQDWTTHWVTDPKKAGPTYPAKKILDRMAECAWHCGDPGVQYDTTINRWHTCPNSGRINASNPCVTGDTLVATSEGYRRIDSLVGESAEIIGGHGKKVWVEKTFSTGRKPVYELRTRSGYGVRLTADHRVWTENRGDVPAAELTIDDVVKLERPGFGNDFLPATFAELLGAVVGDGCVVRQSDGNMAMVITRRPLERLVAERLEQGIEQCQRWLHEEAQPDIRETTFRSTTVRTVGAPIAVPAKIAEYVDVQKEAKDTRFDDLVFGLDKPSQAAILRGFFTIHGNVFNHGEESQYVSLDCASLQLLEQVQLLLLGFGIRSTLGARRRALGQVITVSPGQQAGVDASLVAQTHSLRVSGESRVRFEEQIGFMADCEKAERLAELNRDVPAAADSLIDRVASLVPCGEEDVYDLTEPVTRHFVANGLVVHNCSEYMFLDDTACNLASVNLMKFRELDGAFDHERFAAACRVFFVAQEILVDHASYPTADIARNSHLFRPLGLGYSNLGSLLMTAGMAYDSDAARGVCGAVTAILHGAANLASAELSEAVGPFEEYDKNREPMLRVMQMHRDAVEQINPECPAYLRDAARKLWDEVLEAGRAHGYRNAQATVLAPTGTISFMMDCDTTGIEPDIALVKYKQLAGGGMLKIVNQTVPLALRTLGYDQPEIESILAYIDREDTIESATDLKPEHLPVFDCAFTPRNGTRSIAWPAHVTMMAAAQPFLSGAISKTVNMPRETTPEEIAQAYFDGWKLGLKALAIYRDGSKDSQPLNTGLSADKTKAEGATTKPRRERLPDTRQSITHKFSVAGHEGYITVGLFPDGRPGELFITMAKEGSTIGGLMDAFGTAVSMSLQYGVPLEDYVRKFSHMRFEPQGHTKHPDIRIAKSLIDYIFRWLGITFLPGFREASLGLTEGTGDRGQEIGGATPVSVAGAGVRSEGGVRSAEGGIEKSERGKGNAEEQSEIRNPKSEIATATQSSPTTAKPKGHTNGHHTSGASTGFSPLLLERAGVMLSNDSAVAARSEQFAGFQTDAPACDNCGAITVRNGNCYLCHNCGNSMGCS